MCTIFGVERTGKGMLGFVVENVATVSIDGEVTKCYEGYTIEHWPGMTEMYDV
jgi:hypothetical protein